MPAKPILSFISNEEKTAKFYFLLYEAVVLQLQKIAYVQNNNLSKITFGREFCAVQDKFYRH